MKPIFALLIIGSLCGCGDYDTSVKTGLEGRRLPDFNLLLMDSLTQLHTDSLSAGNPFVMVVFSPNCPYCRAETDDIIRDMRSLRNIRFLLLSTFPYKSIKAFYDHYQLKQYRNIIVCQDQEGQVYRYFHIQGLPYNAVYGKNMLLKQVFPGKVDIGIIKERTFE